MTCPRTRASITPIRFSEDHALPVEYSLARHLDGFAVLVGELHR